MSCSLEPCYKSPYHRAACVTLLPKSRSSMLFVKEAVSGAGAGCSCMQPCQMPLFLLNCRSAQELPFFSSQMSCILLLNGRFCLFFFLLIRLFHSSCFKTRRSCLSFKKNKERSKASSSDAGGPILWGQWCHHGSVQRIHKDERAGCQLLGGCHRLLVKRPLVCRCGTRALLCRLVKSKAGTSCGTLRAYTAKHIKALRCGQTPLSFPLRREFVLDSKSDVSTQSKSGQLACRLYLDPALLCEPCMDQELVAGNLQALMLGWNDPSLTCALCLHPSMLPDFLILIALSVLTGRREALQL